MKKKGIKKVISRKIIIIFSLILVPLTVLSFVLTQLAFSSPTYSLPKFNNVDKIEIRTNHDGLITTITNPQKISAIIELINPYEEKWTKPWYGTPITTKNLQFYFGEEYLGSVGFSETTLTSQREGDFFSQPVSSDFDIQLFQLILKP